MSKNHTIIKMLSPQISIFEYHDFIILKVLWASIEKHQLSCYLEIILDAAWQDVANFPPEIAKYVFKHFKIFKLRAPPRQMNLLAGGFNLSPKMGFEGFLKYQFFLIYKFSFFLKLFSFTYSTKIFRLSRSFVLSEQ